MSDRPGAGIGRPERPLPHITVDYTARLDETFDRLAFAKELQPLVVETTDSAGVCKVFFRPAAETYVAGTEEAVFAHVDVGLLPGRPAPLKSRLAEALLHLLHTHVPPRPGALPVLSVEVRDLSPSYRLTGEGLRGSGG
ncbi:5-carboxymethyl-2-hydroxymuconate Delta-isomerase [Streptomyces sp. NPDC007088]|uniref:5-carboxymethyl-2-hydroxymuconate Delta-isomerase n=1 Tax=Streptomyces sp. NPDC007088 TaxID=3364773 RepID=UPI0036A134A2